MSTNSVPDHAAIGWTGRPRLYEVRADGSLWERAYASGPWTASPAETWRRVGKRSDWLALWGGGGTVLGLTKDGTVWTWGIDPGSEPEFDFAAKLKVAQMRLRAWFSSRSPMLQASASQPYREVPRPLLRLVGTGPLR